MEGALKIKELTYIHCQGFEINKLVSGHYNYFKFHPGTPLLVILLDDEHKETLIKSIKALRKRTSVRLFAISDCRDSETKAFIDENCEKSLSVPKSDMLSALLCIMPLQLIAYDLTVALGYDPDRPRNLSKELTTH